jgi:hypothetical protein
MYQMIRYKPEARITAAKALEHPWLAAFYDPEEEEWGPKPQLFTRWKEIESLNTVEEFREAIWEEIQVSTHHIKFTFVMTSYNIGVSCTSPFISRALNVPSGIFTTACTYSARAHTRRTRT